MINPESSGECRQDQGYSNINATKSGAGDFLKKNLNILYFNKTQGIIFLPHVHVE